MQVKSLLLALLFLCIFTVSALAQPKAGFTIGNVANTPGPVTAADGLTIKVCKGTTLVFHNNSDYNGTPIQTVAYTFQNAQPASYIGFADVSVSFSANGIVKQEVTDYDGKKDSIKISIVVSDVHPKADFNISPQPPVCGYNDFTFTGTSTGDALHNLWAFDNSSTETSTANPAIIKFDRATGIGTGKYNVSLTVTNSEGCSDIVTKSFSINQIPDITVTSPNSSLVVFNHKNVFSVCADIPDSLFQFVNASTTLAGNKKYHIDWGDGTAVYDAATWGTGNMLTHRYSKGYHTMTVTVTGANANGCDNTKTFGVFVGTNPGGGFGSGGNTTGFCIGDSLRIPLTSFEKNADGTLYVISINESPLYVDTISQADILKDPTYRHKFTQPSCPVSDNKYPNQFTVHMDVVNPCGSTPFDQANILVSGKPTPQMNISPSKNICMNTPVIVQNTTIWGGAYLNGKIPCDNTPGQQVWVITGGPFTVKAGEKTGTLNPWSPGSASLNLNFTGFGTYTIKLYVRVVKNGASECAMKEDSIVEEICVRNPPVAKFSLDTKSACAPFTMHATKTSAEDPSCGGEDFAWTIKYLDTAGCNGTPGFHFTDSTTKLANINFTKPGRYEISLNVFAKGSGSGSGCSAVFIDTVRISAKPGVTLAALPAICIGDSVKPVATVSPCFNKGTLVYRWNIAGDTSSLPGPGFKVFTTAGKYPVSIKVTNDCGDSTIADTIYVNDKPVITAVKDTTICSGNAVHLPLSATGNGIVYTWTSKLVSGGITGNTSQQNQPVTAIDDILVNTGNPPAGSVIRYQVIASARGALCISDTVTVNVTVLPVDSAHAGADQFLCKGQDATLLDAVPLKSGARGTWSQPGLTKATIADINDPKTTFSGLISGSVYTLVWTISNTGNNCVDSTDTVSISLLPIFNKIDTPGAAICSGSQVILTGPGVTGGNGTYSYQWQSSSDCVNFTDINGEKAAALSATPQPNTCYRRMVFSGNCSDTSNSVKIFVNTVTPVPLFTPKDTVGCGPFSITFINQTTPTPGQFTYTWDFGNGSTSASVQPGAILFPINTNGYGDTSYKVVMKAFNGCVTVVSDTAVIQVKSKPKASFSPSTSNGCSPLDVLFTNNSAGSNVSYTWDFGDGSQPVADNSRTITHQYHANITAIFKAKLVAVNECGADTMVINVVVNPNAIDLHLAINGDQKFGCTGQDVMFINNTTGANIFHWDFGDPASGANNTLTTENGIGTVNHTYNAIGVYTARLCAGNGCTLDTCTTQTIEVKSKPTAAFTAKPTEVCVGDMVALTNQSLPADGTLAYNWNFGDDSTSAAINPQHAYTVAGAYTISLTASQLFNEGFGCTDSASALITVNGPSGTLSYGDTLCPGGSVKLEAKTNNTDSYIFYFGDGNSQKTTSPVITHTYTLPGNYLPYVTLIKGGCSKDVSGKDSIRVDTVKADFDINISSYCNSTVVQFIDKSYAYFGVKNLDWGIDISAGNVPNPSKTFTTSGTYNVSLMATGYSGCSNTIVKPVEVYVHGTPAGSILLTDVLCSRNSIHFTADVAANDPVTSDWDFNNGYKATGANVSTVYNQPGNYTVILINRTDFGCRDTLYKTVNIKESPVVNAGPDITICQGKTTGLTATGTGVITWSWSPVNNLTCSSCANPQANPATTTSYTVTGANSFGCSDTDGVLVNVVQPFTITVMPADTAICIGNSVHLFASGADTYAWSPQMWMDNYHIADPVVTPPTSLTASTQVIYTVTGYDAFNCFTDSKDATVLVGLIPTIELGTGDSGVAGRKEIIRPVVTNGPFKSYTWQVISGHGSVNCRNEAACAEPELTINDNTTFLVTAENIYGCSATDTIHYQSFCSQGEQVYIPNAFSPDNDGINDVFMVQGRGIVVEYFRVYNRWGQVIFDGGSNFAPNLAAKGWNGTVNGNQPATDDVYVYLAKIKCTASNESYIKKGNVTLIRVPK